MGAGSFFTNARAYNDACFVKERLNRVASQVNLWCVFQHVVTFCTIYWFKQYLLISQVQNTLTRIVYYLQASQCTISFLYGGNKQDQEKTKNQRRLRKITSCQSAQIVRIPLSASLPFSFSLSLSLYLSLSLSLVEM